MQSKWQLVAKSARFLFPSFSPAKGKFDTAEVAPLDSPRGMPPPLFAGALISAAFRSFLTLRGYYTGRNNGRLLRLARNADFDTARGIHLAHSVHTKRARRERTLVIRVYANTDRFSDTMNFNESSYSPHFIYETRELLEKIFCSIKRHSRDNRCRRRTKYNWSCQLS